MSIDPDVAPRKEVSVERSGMTNNNNPARGRPKGSKAKLRSQRVVTFLTEAEYVEVSHRSSIENKSISALIHELVVQSLSK